jgi:hypothetical protein
VPPLGRLLHQVFLALLALGLTAGLLLHWKDLRNDLESGARAYGSRSGAETGSRTNRWTDALTGVSVELPDGVEVAISAAGVVLRKDAEATRVALVAPLVPVPPAPPASVLKSVLRRWSIGTKETSEELTAGLVHDEGAAARASLETGRGADALVGEVRVVATGAGMRLEAFWSLKDEWDRERAGLDALARAVRLGSGQPLRLVRGARHAAVVPDGFVFDEDAGGVQVSLANDPRVSFGLATSASGKGVAGPEELIAAYLVRSRGLSEPTSGLVRPYPPLESPPGVSWEITARDLEYRADGHRVRALLTAAVGHGRATGPVFLLSVRQAPPEAWGRWAGTLAAIEASARLTRERLSPPLAHPEGAGEIVEGLAYERALRTAATAAYREPLFDRDEMETADGRETYLMPLALAQPDGTYLDPGSPGRFLVRRAAPAGR